MSRSSQYLSPSNDRSTSSKSKRKLNYYIYQQDTYDHRNYLDEILQQKVLKEHKHKKPNATMTVRNDQGKIKFNVGYSGNINQLYQSSVHEEVKELQEKKEVKRLKKRSQMYKGLIREQWTRIGSGRGQKASRGNAYRPPKATELPYVEQPAPTKIKHPKVKKAPSSYRIS